MTAVSVAFRVRDPSPMLVGELALAMKRQAKAEGNGPKRPPPIRHKTGGRKATPAGDKARQLIAEGGRDCHHIAALSGLTANRVRQLIRAHDEPWALRPTVIQSAPVCAPACGFTTPARTFARCATWPDTALTRSQKQYRKRRAEGWVVPHRRALLEDAA